MDDDFEGEGPEDFDEFGDPFDGPAEQLDAHETAMVRQDLDDLEDFEAVFSREGYRGVSVFCRDCAEDHFYLWELLRENLNALLDTGETPVHEPAFAPDPGEYVPWEYARGYVDAMREAGVFERREVDACPRCDLKLGTELGGANWCPRCGHQLLATRLEEALGVRLGPEQIAAVMREVGLPKAE